MNKNLRSRFGDAPWMEKMEERMATVGGAGGIGSWLSLYLSRLGMQVQVYDFDTIEEHNIGGQWYKKQDINKAKVIALQENIMNFADQDIVAIKDRLTERSLMSEYCFSAFDNMQARKDMFKAWKEANKDNPNAVFIDGRLAAETFEIYCIRNTPEDIAYYEDPEILFDDSEVPDAPCTMKQTSHFAGIIGGLMTTFFTNYITNEIAGEEERRLPRKTTYMGMLNRFNSEYP